MWDWAMRGEDRRSGSLFSYVDLEARVAADHPLRRSGRSSTTRWASCRARSRRCTRPSADPRFRPNGCCGRCLLQAFYSIRSERLLMEQLDYNLLYRWFVGLGIDDPVWHPTAFTTNRDRLLEGEVAAKFLAAVLGHARVGNS